MFHKEFYNETLKWGQVLWYNRGMKHTERQKGMPKRMSKDERIFRYESERLKHVSTSKRGKKQTGESTFSKRAKITGQALLFLLVIAIQSVSTANPPREVKQSYSDTQRDIGDGDGVLGNFGFNMSELVEESAEGSNLPSVHEMFERARGKDGKVCPTVLKEIVFGHYPHLRDLVSELQQIPVDLYAEDARGGNDDKNIGATFRPTPLTVVNSALLMRGELGPYWGDAEGTLSTGVAALANRLSCSKFFRGNGIAGQNGGATVGETIRGQGEADPCVQIDYRVRERFAAGEVPPEETILLALILWSGEFDPLVRERDENGLAVAGGGEMFFRATARGVNTFWNSQKAERHSTVAQSGGQEGLEGWRQDGFEQDWGEDGRLYSKFRAKLSGYKDYIVGRDK